MKNLAISLVLLAVIFSGLFWASPIVLAQEEQEIKEVNIYFFQKDGCGYCKQEKLFLEKLKQKYDNVNILSFEVTKSRKSLDLLKQVGEKFQTQFSHVPITIVGDYYFEGWKDEKTSGAALEQMIQNVLENNRPDVIGPMLPKTIKLPFIGEVEPQNFSLPALSIIIGGLDGFNPCAMWVLLFLIALLLGMKDKKRMWILGSVFIVASAAVYFVLMAAWLNLLLFLGFVLWIRILIALLALGSGAYYLKTYFTVPPGTCDVVRGKQQQKIFDKLKIFIQEKHFWLALVGIVILAFAVNTIEAVCSAGLPVIYTQILTLAELPIWQYYAYLLLYVFVFMLDDLIVFFVAMWTLQTVAFTGKYSHLSRLIGGILMVIIGLLLLFRPEWLMF